MILVVTLTKACLEPFAFKLEFASTVPYSVVDRTDSFFLLYVVRITELMLY